MDESERIVIDDNERNDKITHILYGYPKDRTHPAYYIDVTKESCKINLKNTIVIPGGHYFSDKLREKYFGQDKINEYFKVDKEKEVVTLRKNGERKVYSKWKKVLIRSDYLFSRHFKSKVTD